MEKGPLDRSFVKYGQDWKTPLLLAIATRVQSVDPLIRSDSNFGDGESTINTSHT